MRKYIEYLRNSGQLSVIDKEVDPRHELAAVTRAAQLAGEKAVLFNNVNGTSFPVITNIYASYKRICEIIGAPEDGFCKQWKEITDSDIQHDIYENVDASAKITSGKLSELPLITYHEKDAGAYFTSGIFLAKEPDTGVPNLSFHRSMFVSDTELRCRLGMSHDLARYQKKAEDRNQPLEAAILIGTSPEIFLAACSGLRYEENELEVAAKIKGAALPMRSCQSIDLEVPADTEIVIEGRFLPNTRRPEAPFGEFMGNYVAEVDSPVFEVTNVSWQQDASFHSLLCGSHEDLRPLEAMYAARVYRHVSSVVPGVIDVSTRPNGLISIIRLKKQYEGHGKQALLAAIGSHMDHNKVVIAVDEDVDIQDMEDVMWAYLVRGRADKRAMIIEDVPGFYRDDMKDHWGRLAIDATLPWGREVEFERKTVPGLQDIRLEDYLG